MEERAYKYILFSVEDGVATITLNRPERSNAFHFGLGVELEGAYARCDEEDDIRAVILTGAGKAFCVGADMGGGEKTFSDVEGARRAAEPRVRRRQLRRSAAVRRHEPAYPSGLAPVDGALIRLPIR